MKYTMLIWFAAVLCGFFFFNAYQLELFLASFSLLVLFACLSVGQASNKDGAIMLERSGFVMFFIALWGVMAVSVIFADVKMMALIGLCLSSVLPLTFFSLIGRQNGDDDFKVILPCMALLYAGLSIWALVQYYIFPLEFGGQAHHPLANPNSLAAVFSLGLFATLGAVISSADKTLRYALWALLALIFAGLVVTASRGAFLAGGVGLLVFAILNAHFVRRYWKVSAVVLICGAILLGFTAFGAVQQGQMLERLGRVFANGDFVDLIGGRLYVWQSAWEIIKAHPMIGTGIGTFFLYYPEYRLPQEFEGVIMAHNDPLQLMTEIGVTGPILFYGLGLMFILRTFKALKLLDKTAPERFQLTAILSAVLAMVLQAHVTFNFYVVPILFITGLMLAWWYLKTQSILGENKMRIPFSDVIGVSARQAVFVIPLVLIAGVFASFLMSEHYAMRAKKVIAGQEMQHFAQLINLSNEIGLKQNYKPYTLAVTVPMSIIQVEKDNMSDEQLAEIFQEAWSYLNTAERLNPRDATIQYYRGYLLNIVPERFYPDGIKTEDEYYERAIELNPLHISAREELMRIYRNKNEMDRFENVLEQGLPWRYNTSRALAFYAEAERYYILTEQLDKYSKLQKEKSILKSRIKEAQGKSNSTRLQRLFGAGSDEI